MVKFDGVLIFCVKFALVLISIMCLIPFAACSGADKTGGGTDGNMNVEIGENGEVRNGTAYETYSVETGYRGVLSIVISKVSGVIDIDVYRAENESDSEYKGRNLDDAEFSVILGEPDEYKVRVTLKDFVGEYEIRFTRESANG